MFPNDGLTFVRHYTSLRRTAYHRKEQDKLMINSHVSMTRCSPQRHLVVNGSVLHHFEEGNSYAETSAIIYSIQDRFLVNFYRLIVIWFS